MRFHSLLSWTALSLKPIVMLFFDQIEWYYKHASLNGISNFSNFKFQTKLKKVITVSFSVTDDKETHKVLVKLVIW